MTESDIRASCHLRLLPTDEDGCCTWDTFLESFVYFWPRWFKAPPTRQQWSMAKRDWKAGNTGYEAAHNAQRRMFKASLPGFQQERQARALTRSLLRVVKGAPADPQAEAFKRAVEWPQPGKAAP